MLFPIDGDFGQLWAIWDDLDVDFGQLIGL
jgi:hypothetical protein